MEDKNKLKEAFDQAGAPALGAKYAKEYDVAKAALDRADAQELFVLWERAVKEQAKTLEAFGQLLTHYAGKSDAPRYTPSDVTEAMKVVSLAAIELARSVALREVEEVKA
jgi:hypothetical protein